MRKLFGLLLALLILAAAIPLAGCSGDKEPTKSPYKVGAVFSTSASQSDLGIPEERTVKMMEEEINDKGGINGHPLEWPSSMLSRPQRYPISLVPPVSRL
ncbi:MAG: hypothetical protein LUO86_07410 [Methanomicrobiales archaeon]|nr:hypothetical protein [Methanomicrobiales archaeon]